MDKTEKKKKVLSGIQPSGNLCISNHIGAIKNVKSIYYEHLAKVKKKTNI